MTNPKRWLPIVIGSGLVALLLVVVLPLTPAFAQGPGGMMGRGMHGGFGFNGSNPGGYGPGWMRSFNQDNTEANPFGYGPGGMMQGFGPGSMMGWGMMGQGMMGSASPLFETEPLTLAEATAAVNGYLATLNNDANLELGEVMIFDNHAYAQIVEQETGIGVMELLVDPTTQTVYPEMGPNMMWNLKYGMMAGVGRYGMMGRYGFNGTAPETSAEMPITPAEAVETAQSYLDTYLANNLTADEQADPFYGYYTLHVNRNGETIGMLSVNGYTGQVFLHTWHGDLVEMAGDDHSG